jgi:hypothetical protein
MMVRRIGATAPGRLAMSEPDPDDAELLAALRAQDPAVARPLWQRFAPHIFRMLRSQSGNLTDWRDWTTPTLN